MLSLLPGRQSCPWVCRRPLPRVLPARASRQCVAPEWPPGRQRSSRGTSNSDPVPTAHSTSNPAPIPTAPARATLPKPSPGRRTLTSLVAAGPVLLSLLRRASWT